MSAQDDDEKRSGELDPFVLQEIFPEAHELTKLGEVPLAPSPPGPALLNSAFFALDTSALLKPYALAEPQLDSLGALYRDLVEGQRLFVPAHALREFAYRRPQKIKELHQRVSDAQKEPLRTTLPGFGRFPEHTRIAELERDITKLLAERDELFKQVLGKIESWSGDDPVNVLYRELFGEDAIVEPDLDTDALRLDIERRFLHKIPPGFKDAGKASNAGGDVVIWHSILAAGRKLKRPAILVSGDRKTDWFYRSKNKPLFERLELVDEYRRASGRPLRIIDFEQFLTLLKANAEVVRQVQLVSAQEAESERVKGHWGYHAEKAVARWLRSGSAEVTEMGFPDFFAYLGERGFFVEVRLASSRPLYVAKAKDVLARAETESAKPLVLVFVALLPEHAERALKLLRQFYGKKRLELGDSKVVIGYLDDAGDFQPLGEVLDRATTPHEL